ncbi:MAG: hypothetical protein JW768_15050 [Chitinispirillaceae bacterium]|nr:hypothetical protein [Chitinispirillaceae bacterium]
MDAAVAAASVQTVNQVLENATNAVLKQSEKLMETAVRMAVGMEIGKGENIDVIA